MPTAMSAPAHPTSGMPDDASEGKLAEPVGSSLSPSRSSGQFWRPPRISSATGERLIG